MTKKYAAAAFLTASLAFSISGKNQKNSEQNRRSSQLLSSGHILSPEWDRGSTEVGSSARMKFHYKNMIPGSKGRIQVYEFSGDEWSGKYRRVYSSAEFIFPSRNGSIVKKWARKPDKNNGDLQENSECRLYSGPMEYRFQVTSGKSKSQISPPLRLTNTVTVNLTAEDSSTPLQGYTVLTDSLNSEYAEKAVKGKAEFRNSLVGEINIRLASPEYKLQLVWNAEKTSVKEAYLNYSNAYPGMLLNISVILKCGSENSRHLHCDRNGGVFLFGFDTAVIQSDGRIVIPVDKINSHDVFKHGSLSDSEIYLELHSDIQSGNKTVEADMNSEKNIDYPKTLCAAAKDIEKLKTQFGQLSQFNSAEYCGKKNLTIHYKFRTAPPKTKLNWIPSLSCPDSKGVWLYIDIHNPDSESAIHRKPVLPAALRIRDKTVYMLIADGSSTKTLQEAIWNILKLHTENPEFAEEMKSSIGE